MAQTFVKKDDWDPKLAQAVGLVAIHFGNLDYLVSLSVARVRGLTGSNKIQLIRKIEGSSLPSRCDKIVASYNKRFKKPSDRKRLAQILRNTKRVSKDRNDAMHALWAEDRTGKPVRIRRQQNLGVKPRSVSELGNEVLKVTEELHVFTKAIPRVR